MQYFLGVSNAHRLGVVFFLGLSSGLGIGAIGNLQKNDLVLGLGDRELLLHMHAKLFAS
jgi:hypothetical protein